MLRLAYLSIYNLYGLLGWSFILFTIIKLVSENKIANVWKELEMPLKYVQTAAILEIVHAMIGLVRSPITRTVPQVFSRVAIVWLAMDPLFSHKSPENAKNSFAEDSHYWFGIMTMTAWCFAEIIRYTFYGLNSIDAKLVPFPLLFLRYSAFLILYPVGVTGEILCAYSIKPLLEAGKCPSLGGYLKGCPSEPITWLYVYLLMYIPGLPFMYLAMLGERRKRLYPKAPPKPMGIVFPVVTKSGDRSTTSTAKAIFAAAMEAVDKDAAQKAKNEKNWRFGYNKHVMKSMVLGAKSEEAALKIARAGLAKMYATFDLIQPDGSTIKLEDAAKIQTHAFHTATIKGSNPKAAKPEIKVPYKCYHTGEYKELSGQALIDQVDKWVSWGTIEPDCGESIKEVVRNPGWSDLSGQFFVVLGTTSAMGPFLLLKELGAHIIAVDLDRPPIWKKIIEEVQQSSASVSFPMKVKYANQTGDALYTQCGCNLMNEAPQIAAWLNETIPVVCKGRPVTIGGYAYLDGELHVRVNLACDLIMNSVVNSYGPKNVRLANLCTPTDCYLIPEAANKAARDNLKTAPMWQKIFSAVLKPLDRMVPNALRPIKSDDDKYIHLMDGLVLAQGPNYALAKRLQQWRAVIARSQGCTVSINIAPATATKSVVHNKQFAAAYGGMHVFKPMEIFYQEVSNAVMGMLLIFDISSPNSPALPTFKLANPQLLFAQNAFHGGAMRCVFKFTSIGEIAALLYYVKTYSLVVFLLGGVMTAAVLGVLFTNHFPIDIDPNYRPQ